jgi:cytidine deaminase
VDVPRTELFAAALAAQQRAHCPYSGYRVGAAIRTVSGEVFAGCNVENAAYPLGSCAEAGAIAAMVLGGRHQIADVVTVTDGDAPGTPCGGCRQRLREFTAPDVVITSTTATGGLDDPSAISMTMAQLLPESFGPEFLAPLTSSVEAE